ncbi:hypothetical protein ARMGADRAFT_529342 [Armillaria gallica]|uniref:Uncharacterized protein n=1 Tax=Armillaria gallica TaxID=47427 RepID=A0A2H3CTZ8_ARMGA|nr:hypothetical protein ARMGADRAFT_529342 [Armillaria gallica]
MIVHGDAHKRWFSAKRWIQGLPSTLPHWGTSPQTNGLTGPISSRDLRRRQTHGSGCN